MNVSLKPIFSTTMSRVPSENMGQNIKVKSQNQEVEAYVPDIRITDDMVGKNLPMTSYSEEEKDKFHQQSTEQIIANIDLTNTNRSEFVMAMHALNYRGETTGDAAGLMAITVALDQNLDGDIAFNAIEYFEGVAAGGTGNSPVTSDYNRGLTSLLVIDAAHKAGSDSLRIDTKA